MTSPEPHMPALGEYAPWFFARSLGGSERFAFHTLGGRHILMLFHGSAANAKAAAALELARRRLDLLDDEAATFIGITADPGDEKHDRIAVHIPGIRHFLDYDRSVSEAYGVADKQGNYRQQWILLDPEMRIVGRFPLDQGEAAFAELSSRLARVSVDRFAPVLTIPEVFEPELCRRLIELYEREGGEPSGFMRDVGGKTTMIFDDAFKQRRDHMIEDQELVAALNARIARRIVPVIQRCFFYTATRVERHLVACYEAGAGHFRAHRDNTTFGTAHRRFAVTINLNAEEFEGGELRFPEFGPRSYRATTGGAVVFSCSLLHEALPVTQGKRYAFLPFLYDDAARAIRESNLERLAQPHPPAKDGTAA